MEAKIISIQIGKAKSYGDKESKTFFDKYWESASFKDVVNGEVWVGKLGIIGDEVADKVHHGGLDKAVFANSYQNYPHWKEFLKVSDIPFGALAENLTVSKLHESNVCLGDIHKIGNVLLQVSQPRKPCWKISRRWNNKEFTNEIYTSGLTGWYYRVLEEGTIKPNDTVSIMAKNSQEISILEANKAYENPSKYYKTLEKILKITSLALSYESSIIKRLNGNADLGYMNVE